MAVCKPDFHPGFGRDFGQLHGQDMFFLCQGYLRPNGFVFPKRRNVRRNRRKIPHSVKFQRIAPFFRHPGKILAVQVFRRDQEEGRRPVVPAQDGAAGRAVFGDPVVFPQGKRPVRPRENFDPQRFRVPGAVGIFRQIRHGHDPARFCQDGDVFPAAVKGQLPATVVVVPGKEIKPASFRQPCGKGRPSGFAVQRAGDGAGNQLVAEPVLIFYLIGFRLLRMGIVHGPDQRLPLRRQIVHGIQVRNQLMAQFQIPFHHFFGSRGVIPRFLSRKRTVGTVQAHNGGENAELHPAHRQLFVPVTVHMAADVMAPPAIPCVACVGREVGLKVQGFPGDDGVPGKAHGIPVASQAGIAGKGQPPLSVFFAVQEMVMVEHPQRIQPGNPGFPALLPVHPPKIHPLLFHGMVQAGKIRFQEIRIRPVKFNGFPGFGIPAQGLCHGRILLFKRTHPFRRMYVQRRFDVVPMKPV